ncbi:MAG TPA: alpha/beta fold hydrolase [Acidimicrobiales bacterium]|nr:alpha/beta fold hydrolase [Acidimicrobiales bacterium]
MGEPVTITSGRLALAGYLAKPSTSTGSARYGLIISHGFPEASQSADAAGKTFPELADRLARDAEWTVLTFNFRGTGESQGDFSLGGWLADLRAAVDFLLGREGVEGVWLCGFSAGGTLSICAAGEDERVRGVAALAAPADFNDWAADPRRFLAQARAVGVIRHANFPLDSDAWARELREVKPLALIAKIPPRPLLLVHGANDDIVPMLDALALADAAEGQVELRILAAASHHLRHDPRAIAILLGWLDRQLV